MNHDSTPTQSTPTTEPTRVHHIGADVRVRPDAQSRHAGQPGIVIERYPYGNEPRPVLVRLTAGEVGATALYADADLTPLDDWRAADPPICPTCGCDHSYAAWEYRDSVRGVIRENAALRKELGYWKSVVEDPYLYWGVDDPPYPLYPDDAPGDLDGAGEGGE